MVPNKREYAVKIALDGRFIQDHYPGIGRYTYHLALALTQGYPQDAFVIFYQPNRVNTRYDLDALAKLENVRLGALPAPPLSLASQLQVRRLIRQCKADLFHSPHYPIPFVAGCPIVATLHDITPLTVPGLPRSSRWAFRVLMHLAAQRSAAVITGSKYAAGDLIRRTHIDRAHLYVVPHGVEEAFRPASQSEVARVRAKLHLERPYCLYCGSNKPHKNLRGLVQAWVHLSADLLDQYELVTVGAEDLRYPGIGELARQYGLAGVRALGNCAAADLPAIYSGAAAFIFPSLSEGFGLPVLEAMACGTPVACADNTALPEVAGDAALLFDASSPGQITQVINRLLTDQPLRDALRGAGLARAAQFSWSCAASRTMQVYRAVYSQAHGGALLADTPHL